MKKWMIFLLWSACVSPAWASSDHGAAVLQKAETNLYDKASLQRGAGIFMNYCAGCHSLQYVRYSTMARDFGMVDDKGAVLEGVIKSQLNFVSDKSNDNILSSMSKVDSAKWFGIPPPDLSLVARSRGPDWLYTYLKGFYIDAARPWGVNNQAFPNVGMPHVLLELQGTQVLNAEGHLELLKPGLLSAAEYDQAVRDLVNFLDYVGEPAKIQRERLGVWVLLFLMIFLVFAALLKREYWKDIR